jgi:O-antigen ligase
VSSIPHSRSAAPARIDYRYTLIRILLVVTACAGIAVVTLMPTRYAIAVPVGLVAAAAILRYPIVGLCLLGFAVPWGSSLPLGSGSLPLTPTDMIAAGLGVAWLVDAVVRRRNPIADAVLAPYIGFYLLAVVLSVTQSRDLAASAREIIKWIEFAEIFFVALWFLRTRLHLRLFAAALVCGGVSQAALGFFQFLEQAGPAAFGLHRAFFRSYGSFDQPNPYAGYLNMVIPLAAVMALKADRRGERTLYWSATLFMVLALLASQSRGALLAALVAGVVLAACFFRRARPLLGLAAVAATAFALGTTFAVIPTGPLARVMSAVGLGGVSFGDVTNANFSAVERAAHWLAGVRMFAAHPFLGVGIGNYSVAYPAYHPRGWYASLEHAHNYYINIAAEAGIIGLTSYTLMVGSALWYIYAIVRRTRDNVCFAVAVGALGALVATSFHNIFDVLYVHGMATLLGSILALAPAGRHVDLVIGHVGRVGNGHRTERGSFR